MNTQKIPLNNQKSNKFSNGLSLFYFILSGIVVLAALGFAFLGAAFSTDNPNIQNPLLQSILAFLGVLAVGLLPAAVFFFLGFYTKRGSKLANAISVVLGIILLIVFFYNLEYVVVVLKLFISVISFLFGRS